MGLRSAIYLRPNYQETKRDLLYKPATGVLVPFQRLPTGFHLFLHLILLSTFNAKNTAVIFTYLFFIVSEKENSQEELFKGA